MMLLQKIRHRWPIGLDIGESGFRLVQLTQSAGGLSVHQAACWLPESDTPESVQRAHMIEHLSQLLSQGSFLGRKVITTLNMPQLELHNLELPAAMDQLPDPQVHKAASWEIQRLTTLNKNELQTGFWRLPTGKRVKSNFIGVATAGQEVINRVQICDEADTECVKVDVATCALARLVWRLRGQVSIDVWGVLDLGYRHARLMMCVDDTPVLVRCFPMGGKLWTEKIAAGMNVSYSAAERNKCDEGLGGTDLKGSDPAMGVDSFISRGEESGSSEIATLMMGILRDDLQRLALETERSYEYVLQTYAPRVPGDLVMVGGGALLGGLGPYLSKQLGIKVYKVSECVGQETQRLVNQLKSVDSLEICALACASSWAEGGDHV